MLLPEQLQQATDLHQLLLQDRSHRAEAKSWLIQTLSQLRHVSPAARWACFNPRHDAAPSSPVATCRPAELQVLQLLVESVPADVSALLLRDPDWVCSFLTASRDRIRAWFAHFGPTGISQLQYGARAIANYALAERAEAWHHLVWAGKHSQSPVAVAAKPHYFGELDVVATVQQLARSCPGFWRSDELSRSCQAGDWLLLDTAEVAKELRRLLHDDRSSRHQPLQRLLADILASADWVQLCQKLLPLLPDSGVLQVAKTLAAGTQQVPQQQQQQHRRAERTVARLAEWCRKQQVFNQQHTTSKTGAAQASTGDLAALQAAATGAMNLPCVSDADSLLLGCLQSAVATGADSWSLDQLLLADALTCYRGQLLTLLKEDEDAAAQLLALTAAAAAMCSPSADAAAAAGSAFCPPRLSELPAALVRTPLPQRILLLLEAGWLLRLHLLLQLSAELDEAGSQAQQQQQLPAVLSVTLPTGGVSHMLTAAAASPAAAYQSTTLQEQGQGRRLAAGSPLPVEQQQQQEEVDQEQQQQQRSKQPLRRGAAAQADKSPTAHHSDSSSGEATRPRSKHKLSKPPSSKKKKRRKHRTDHSSSSSDDDRGSKQDGGGSSSSSSGHRPRRRKHKRRRRQHSSGSGSGRDDADADEWTALDLDAGGRLLDPSDFSNPPSSKAARHSSSKLHAVSPSAAPAAAVVGGTPCGGGGGDDTATEQQQRQQGSGSAPELSPVLERLSNLSVGGRMWQWPTCVVVVPTAAVSTCQGGSRADSAAAAPAPLRDRERHPAAAGSTGQCVVVAGSIVEVADAAAQLWLCDALQQAHVL